GVPPAGVLRSDDGGATWQPSNGGLPYSRIYSVAAGPTGVVFATADWRIYRSGDRGSTWTLMPAPNWPGVYGFQLLLAPAGDVLYAWPYGLMTTTADGAGPWIQHDVPASAGAFTVTANGTVLLIDYTGQNVSRSLDHGSTWTTRNNVLPPEFYQPQYITSGRYGRVAYSADAAGTRISDDDGLTWRSIGSLYGRM